MKRFLSWVIALSILPVTMIILATWYYIVSHLMFQLSTHFPKVLKVFSLLSDMTAEAVGTGLLGLALTFIVIWVCQKMVDLSQKVYPSRYAVRFFVTGILGAVIVIACVVAIIKGMIKGHTPLVDRYGMLVVYTLISFGTVTFIILRDTVDHVIEGVSNKMKPKQKMETIPLKIVQANTILVYCYAVDDASLKALEEISQSKIVDVYQAIGFHTDDNIDFHVSYKKPFLTLRATLPDASSIVIEPQAHMTDGAIDSQGILITITIMDNHYTVDSPENIANKLCRFYIDELYTYNNNEHIYCSVLR